MLSFQARCVSTTPPSHRTGTLILTDAESRGPLGQPGTSPAVEGGGIATLTEVGTVPPAAVQAADHGGEEDLDPLRPPRQVATARQQQQQGRQEETLTEEHGPNGVGCFGSGTAGSRRGAHPPPARTHRPTR